MAEQRSKELTDQLVVRVPRGLYEALRDDAEQNGRTVAQSARFHLSNVLQPATRSNGSAAH